MEYCDKCGWIKPQCQCEKPITNANRIRNMTDAVFGTDGKWHTTDYEVVSFEVIAWQPLPEPYKGEIDE